MNGKVMQEFVEQKSKPITEYHTASLLDRKANIFFFPNTLLCKSVFYADLLAPLLCLQRKYTLVIGDRRCQSILCNEGRFSSATRILCKLFWKYYDHINQFWVQYSLRNSLLLTIKNEVIA